MTAFPLFIVGSPRSGTSILVQALHGGGYFGYNEGNFLSIIRTIERDVDQHFQVYGTTNPRVLTAHLDKEALKGALYRVIGDAVSSLHQGKVWLDKTGNPEMIEAIPILRQLWPESRFIFAKRRAIENIASRVKKFPEHTLEYHCADWAKNMAAWRRVVVATPDLPAIEVDQRDIGEAPFETAGRIAAFLELPAEAQARVAAIFGSEVPQQTEPGSARRTISLAATGWTEQQLKVFHRNCDEQMRAYGYSEDESYRSEPERPGTPRKADSLASAWQHRIR